MTHAVRAVAQVVPPAVGGIRSHVRSLVPRLEALGIDAPVFGPDGVLGADRDVNVVPIPARAAGTGWYRAVRMLRSALGPVDLLHAHGMKAAVVADRARAREPLVVTVHNVVLPARSGRPRRAAEALADAVWSRADRLVVPSASVLDCLPRDLHDRARVVAPVVDVPPPGRTSEEVRRSYGIPSEAPLVVCVARYHRQKRLDVLATAWARLREQLPGAWLVVVGDGPERRAVTASVGSQEHVVLTGAVSPASDVLAAADVVVVSSDWEAVPLVLVEALTLGVPVVSTDVGVAGAVLTGDRGAVVPVGDGAGLAVALRDVLVAARVGATRRSSATVSLLPANQSPDRLVEELVAVYQELT